MDMSPQETFDMAVGLTFAMITGSIPASSMSSGVRRFIPYDDTEARSIILEIVKQDTVEKLGANYVAV